MRITKMAILLALFIVLILSLALFAEPEKEIQKTFDKKDEVRLKFALGDCRIEKSRDGKIHVHLVYSYQNGDIFEPRFEEKARYLYLHEKFHGNNPKGYSRWTVAVPDDTEIDFSSGTGNLTISGLKLKIDGSTGTGEIEISDARGELEAKSGTGNVDVINSEGEFDLSSGTGSVRVENSKGKFDVSSGTGKVSISNSNGNFDASSGTGRVEANGLTIEYEGEFSCGTGDVEVSFPKGEDFDLTVSSGTDDAVVDMQGQPIQGYFEFTANARKGRIICPVKFDKEEEFLEGDNKYLQKSFTKGKKSPRVYIKTGTGTARLKE